MESPLVLEKSSELSLGGISLGSLVYLSNDGLLVGSESSGRVHCYDIVSKRKLSSFDPSTGLPSLFAVASHSDKLVVCNGSSLGSRKSLDGRLLLDTILQPPLNDHEALVRIEILHEEVILLLNEMKSLRHISTDMTSLVARLIKVFGEYIERENKLNHLDTEESHDQIRNWSYCIIEEPLKGLYELFNKMFLQYQPAKANSGGARPSSSTDPLPPVAEIISAIRFRLHLLHPVHYPHVHNLETGLENLSNNADTALMLSEGMRRISFNNWIHKDYLWAEQNKMSEAGLYLFVNTPVNHLVSTAKGDRTTCFTCGIYIHRWLPSDEPWSEHTRHSKCPFMRGEFTLNVPAKFTEGTHSSVHCISPVAVMSNVSDSNMVAVATIDNKIQLWDIGHSLFIHECAVVDFGIELAQSNLKEHQDQLSDDSILAATPTVESSTPPISPPSPLSSYIDDINVITSLAVKQWASTGTLSLITAATCLKTIQGTPQYIPTIILHIYKPNKITTSTPSPPTNTQQLSDTDSLYDLLVDQSLAPDVVIPPVVSSSIDNKSYPLEITSDQTHSGSSMPRPHSGSVSFQSCLLLDKFAVPTTTHDQFPRIRQVISLPRDDLVVINVAMETVGGASIENSEPAAELIVLKIEEDHLHELRRIIIHDDDSIIDVNHFTYKIGGKDKMLLAAATMSGKVKVYDMDEGMMVGTYDDGRFTHVLYCQGLDQLAAVDGNAGIIHLLDIKDKMDWTSTSDWSTVPIGISTVTDLMAYDPRGIPFIGQCQSNWIEMNPLRYHQHAPKHMLQRQDKNEYMDGRIFNTKIWKYMPALDDARNGNMTRHLFKLSFSHQLSSISSFKLQLNFASSSCIDDSANVTLFVSKSPQLPSPHTRCDNIPSSSIDPSLYEPLCGPFLLKPYLDVTDLSIILTLSHPRLLSSVHSTFLLSFDQLFVSNYSQLTEEAAALKSSLNKKSESEIQLVRRRGVRCRIGRTENQSTSKQPLAIVHSTLLVTMFPYTGPLSLSDRLHLIPIVFSPDMIYRMIWRVCGGRFEADEYGELPVHVGSLLEECKDPSCCLIKDQYDALDVLCWVASVADCDNDRSFFNIICSVTSQLLKSLLFACYFSCGRPIAHKFAQFLSIIIRNRSIDHVVDEFVMTLSQSFLHFVPLISLIPTASNLEWFLQQMIHYVPLSSVHQFLPVLLDQLMRLTHNPIIHHDNHWKQILETNYLKDGSIFDIDLYDIPLSYPIPSSPPQHVDIYSNDALTPPTVSTHTTSKPSTSTTEFTLLKGKKEPGGPSDIAPYAHGTHLLYTQRGLLETFPLDYKCVEVSIGAAVKEDPKSDTSSSHSHRLLTAYLNIHHPMKLVGYMFGRQNQSDAPSQSTTPISHVSDLPLQFDVLSKPKELSLTVDGLKPGTSHSAVIEFKYPVALTDLSVKSNPHVFAVSIRGWLNKGREKEESILIAESADLNTSSLMIGTLHPSCFIRYLRVTFVASMNASSEKSVISLGEFYGQPVQLNESQLLQMESKYLSSYFKQLQELKDLLSMSTQHFHLSEILQKQFKDQFSSIYKSVSSSQVKLARVRNMLRYMKRERKELHFETFHANDLMSDSSLRLLSSRKLFKCVGGIIDVLLVMCTSCDPSIVQLQSVQSLLTKDNCHCLFQSVCVVGNPSIHPRLCSLLITTCGKMPWWGEFIADQFADLFSSSQTIHFNKRRLILQLSILCHCTLEHTNVFECLLSLLTRSTLPLTSSATAAIDDHLVQHLILLIFHILSSKSINGDDSSNPSLSQTSLFSSEVVNISNSSFITNELQHKSDRVNELNSTTQTCLDKVNKMLDEYQTIYDDNMLGILQELKISLEKKNEHFSKISKKIQAYQAKPDSHTGRISLRLPSSLIRQACECLSCFLVKNCLDRNWEIISITCKVLMNLLCSTHSVISLHREQLGILVNLMCCKGSVPTSAEEYQWACFGIQKLLVSLIKKEKLQIARKVTADKVTMEEEEISVISQKCLEISTHLEVVTDDGNDITSVDESLEQLSTSNDAPENNKPLPSCTDLMVDDGPSDDIKHKSEPSSIPQSKPKLKSQRRSFVHLQNFMKQKSTKSNDDTKNPFSHHIISNAINSRLVSDVQLPSELHLQCMSKAVYRNILESIDCAKPQEKSILNVGSNDEEENGNEILYDGPVSSSLHVTLLKVIEEMFNKRRQSAEVFSLLQFWNEICGVALKHTKKNHLMFLFETSNLFSYETLSNLLDLFLVCEVTSWNSIFSLLFEYIRLSYKTNDKKVNINVDKLVSCLMHCCVCDEVACEVGQYKEENCIFDKLMCQLSASTIQMMEGGNELNGCQMLLDVLTRILKERSTLPPFNPYIQSLIQTLQQPSILETLFISSSPLPSSSSHPLQSIKSFLSVVLLKLCQTISYTRHYPFKLWGTAVPDGERNRKFYYSSAVAAVQDLSWMKLEQPPSGALNLSSALVKLCKDILSMKVPSSVLPDIEKYCDVDHTHDHTHTGSYSVQDKPLVDLILKDQKQLTELFLNLRYTQSCDDDYSHLNDFVSFLQSSCSDFSCFARPLLVAMDTWCWTVGGSSEPRHSIFYLIKSLTSERKRDEGIEADYLPDNGSITSFITQGGGHAIMKCLILSASSVKATPINHTLKDSLINLEMQDRPLPYKESSPLINFFPMCTTKCSPSSDSLKDLQSQSVKLKDGPNRSSSFQHTFNKDDKWIKFYMTLKQPILLHQIHIYQPAIYTQNGPSLVKVEVSNLENPGRPIPLSLPINTAGLTGIKIELTTPIIIQEVWIHLYRPLLPQPISLSNFLLLGTHYGSSSSSHTPNNDMTNASYDIIHPSEGWIDILNQWLSSSSQVAVELSSIASEMNVLQTCLSLLTQPLRSRALKGLGSLLLKLSSNCSEVGDQLIPLLIKDMRTKSTANHLLDDGYVIDLILSVCSLEDTSGQRRLMSALELINELTSHDNGDVEHNSLQHLSPVILTLASIIWRQKDILESDQCSIKISDNFYKSLLNCAVSKEVGSALKLSLNALQTSLCRLNPSWFSIAMETATQLVETTPMDGIGRVLHTLSHCSLSDECIKILLDSTFLQDLLDRLVKSLSVIEQDPALHIMTQHLSLVCSSLAFLTDLAFGHREAQSWLVKRENAYFWPILLKTFDKPFLNISKVQLLFCHHTIQQFFAVCYKFNINGKNFLSRLIISAFSGQYTLSKLPPRGSEPLVLKLTPFIKSLMVDHLMNQESIHLILEIRPDVTESIAHVIDIEHLMPTYKSPHYHPSFPLDRNFYYLKLSSEYSLSRLLSLLFSGVSERPFDIKYFFPPLTYIPKFASSEVASTMPPGINVFNFSIKKDSSPVDKTYKSLCFRVGKDGLRLPHNARIKDVPLTATFSCSHVRLLSLSKVTNEEIYCDIETKVTQPTLLQAFANMNGLSVLAELFPYMHPSYWLGDDDRNAMVDVDLSAASIPFDLPHYFTPRSYTAFGLGLRLKEYGELLGCDGTVTNSWYIFRSVLGVNDEGKSLSSSLSDFFSFLPFLYVYRMVKDSSSENLRLRRNMLAKGLIKHLLDCLAVASQQPQEPKESVMIPSTTLPLPSNSATTSNEKQYWAKGTGFGTGSISSSWSVNDILSQHQANEVMTSIILATLAEWLRVPIDYYYKTYTGLDDDEKSHKNPHLDTSDNYIFFAEMSNILESSCLLPTLASYLTNDSILDITNHTQVYKAVLLLILSMCRNTHCHPLLMVDIAPPNGDGNPQHSQRRNIVSLIKHLNSIALVYNKTIKSQKKNPKNVSSQIPTMKQRPLPLPPDQPSHFASSSQEPIEISEVIELILKCGKEITYIQSMEDASTDSAAITTTDDDDSMCTASNDDYIASMKQLQFGTHQMIESELDENSKVIFKVPHYYSTKVEGIPILNPARSRRLAQEITSLASSLPLSTSSSVFVRCDEERMDLMKVLITGPSDTPYANGCFLFDVFFPPEYPSVPMSINLCTTGHGSVRFNPNLYNDGKVCLSVLNTWHGRPEEKWNPLTSSFLQVLVSIQSLILVAEPFFNEPGYEQYRGTPYGDLRSLSYNAVVCNATLQWAMIDIIKNPCPCFKEVILKHFYIRQKEILSQCNRWRQELVDGIKKHQSSGRSTQALYGYLKVLCKQMDLLKVELTKIKPKDLLESK